ncbi:MAG: DUF1571 domain-containing protein [Bacteroidota bacterium]
MDSICLHILSMTLLLSLLCSVTCFSQKVNQFLEKMCKQIESIDQAEFEIRSEERIGQKMVVSTVKARMNTEPFKVYLLCINPNKGVEILYNSSEYGSKAVVNPNGFPYVNINMSPNAAKMRKDKHHSILSLGFHNGGKLIRHVIKMNKQSKSCQITDNGIKTINGIEHRVIEIYNADFGFEPITLERGLTASQVASKYNVSEYLIREKNKLKGFGTIKSGTTLMIPNHFAKRITLFVDTNLMLPVIQEMEDEQGVFERYEYSNIRVNPQFSETIFQKNCPEYNF